MPIQEQINFWFLKQNVNVISRLSRLNAVSLSHYYKFFGKLDNYFSSADFEQKDLHRGQKINYPSKIGEMVISIKDDFNQKEGKYEKSKKIKKRAKKNFREAFPHVAEYVNDYRFKKVQKKLRDIFRNKTAANYEPEQLRCYFDTLEECFKDASSRGWNEQFFSDLYSAIKYVGDQIDCQEPSGKASIRHIPKVMSALDGPEYSVL